jgi:predicted RNA-binding protein with PIN domain
MSLEDQRDRLVKEVTLLARTRKVPTTIVFDGSEVPPGTTRRSAGPVKVRYSAPEEIADDYIVKLVEEMPTFPVVVVTNDRELQHRVKRLGATVATSDQLLSLLR